MSIQAAQINYRTWGDEGPAIVLLHPIGFDLHTWEPVIPYLCDGYRLLALDIPGHGQSDKPRGADYSVPALSARILAFLEEIGWSRAAFVGNSLGGGIALAAALQAPDRVQALVLLNSVGFRAGLHAFARLAFVPLLDRLCSYAPQTAMRLGLRYARAGRARPDENLCVRCRTYLRAPEGRDAFFSTLRSLHGPALETISPQYAQICCPTLVLHGVDDPLIRLSHSEKLAAAIPGAVLKRLPHCGHFPQEEIPEFTGKTIREFLDREFAP